MRNEQIAVQLYSFRDFIKTPEDFKNTLRRLKRIGYSAVQLSSAIPAMTEDELRAILDGEGFTAPTAHATSDNIVRETDRLVERLRRLKCLHVAYPYPHIPLTNLEAVRQAAGILQDAAARMKQAGITLAYHNHDVEFVRFGNRTALDVIYEHAPTLQGEIDTFWVQAGGGSPLDWVRKMYRRMDVIHLKDYVWRPEAHNIHARMAAIGAGNLDWPGILSAAEDGGVNIFVVEHDGGCPDPFVSFEQSLRYLTTHFVR